MNKHLLFRFILISLIGLTWLSPIKGYGQCTNGGSTTVAGALTMQPFYQTINVNSGTRYTFTANAGITYLFSFCEGGGNFTADTQLEICNSAGTTVYAYNDDFCGLGSHISWTCTTTGTYSVVIFRWSCQISSTAVGRLAYRVLTPPTVQDCLGAIPLCDTSYHTTNSYSGQGHYQGEIPTHTPYYDNMCPGNCLLAGELNDVWYTFTVQTSGTMGFLISPNNPSDDYDWAVYDITTANCADIATQAGTLQRSCNFCGEAGPTGPNGGGAPSCQHGNSCTRFNAMLNVTAGQTYVVNLSNFSSTQSGYTIGFNGTAQIVDNTGPHLSNLVYAPYCGSSHLVVQFSERIWCTGVTPSDFILTGPNGTYSISNVWSDLCQAGLNSTYGDTYYDDVWNLALGDYLQHSGNYTLTLVGGGVADICGKPSIQSSINFTINGVEANVTHTNATCYNTNNGTITVSGIHGGTAPYTTNWTGPGGFTSHSNTLTGLAPGTYHLQITDNNGICEYIETIDIYSPPAITANVSTIQPGCGATNGSVTVTPSGGISPWTLQLGAATQSGVTGSYTFNNLGGGTYNLVITDAAGCTYSQTVTLTAPNNPDASFTYNGNQCFSPSHSFNFTHTGTVVPGETYSWTFAGGTPATSTAHNPTGITFSTPGPHNVTLTITAGICSDTETITVNAYPNPTPTVSVTNATCGNCNGGASTTISYSSYSWSTGSSASSITNRCPGAYSVAVTDANGCTGSSPFTISNVGNTPTVSVVTTPPSCVGYCNGSATVNASGAASYTYNYSSGTTPNNQTTGGLCAGSYTVTVADAANPSCYTVQPFTISAPTGMTLTMNSTNPNCGLSNGSASVSVTGGTMPLSYNWSPGGGVTGTINNIPSGTYTVTVTDGSGCTASNSVTLTDTGAPFSLTTSVNSNTTCFNSCNGSATVTPSGSAGPFTYHWSSGTNPTNQTVTGLCAGNHSVTVSSGGCDLVSNVTITQPTAVIGNVTTVGAHCGLPDGSATVNASGGTPGYSYTWNTVPTQTGITAINIPSGNYTVTITDSNGCIGTASNTVPDLGGMTAIISSTPALCNGSNNGSATITVTGGSPNYTYQWSNGFSQTIPSTSSTANGLASGNISVTVTDNFGCTVSSTTTVSQPNAINISLINSTNVSCNGLCNGSATINATGGTIPYSYTWGSGANPNNPTNTGLCSGTHSVTVSDSHACTSQFSYTITQPTPLTVNISKTDANCGFPDGTATANPSGGTMPYTYSWSGGTNPNNQTITGLSSTGNPYSVTVTDGNGCTQTSSITIDDVGGPIASISAYNNITCNGMHNGTATVSVGGGSPGYLYVWNTTPPQYNVTATNLSAGYYEVTVTDQIGCTTTAGITITEPATMTMNVLTQPVACFGNCTGEAMAVVSGGSLPYSFIWTNMSTNGHNTNLCAGNYGVTATDNSGCSLTGTATIIQNSQIVVTEVITNAHCGQSDGSINLTVSGGSSPYTFTWSNGALTEDLFAISAGGYAVTITDNKGCNSYHAYAVNNISGPIATISASNNVSCNGNCNGSATVNVTGAIGIIQYNWSTTPIQTSATATNLCAGFYAVTVTDISNGCSAITGINITQPTQMDVLSTVSPATCYNACTGSIQLTPYDGTAPYSFNWTGPGVIPNNEDIFNLCPGNYTVAITDAHGCIITRNYTVNNPSFITIPTSTTAVACNGICNGTATANPIGGTPPYSYLWSNLGQTSQTAVGLCAGNHTVTVSDHNGCSASTTVTVATPTPMHFANITIGSANCNGSSNGSILVNVTGGLPPYTYVWSNGSNSSNPLGLSAGQHCVTVYDSNGCNIDTCVYLTQPNIMQVNMLVNNVTCYGACNGTITASTTGGQIPYTFLWSTMEVTPTINNLCPGIYLVTVTDANGCQFYSSSSVAGPSLLTAVIQQEVEPTCNNNDGLIRIGAIGGTSPYYYNWSAPGGNTNTLSNIPSGAYTVTVTDANGCTTMLTIDLDDISAPDILGFNVNNVGCNGENSGTAEVLFNSSTINNSIIWSNGQTSATAINLGVGNYTVTITDDNGCHAVGSVAITQPQILQTNIAAYTNLTCNGICNGTATAVAIGGTAPLNYYWSGGQNTNYVTGLCAGSHTVTVIDNNGCSATSSIILSEPPPITATATITPTTCFGSNDGIIAVQAQGGSNNYYFSWPQLGQSGPVAQGLTAGSHTVIIADQSDISCFISQTYTVNQPDQLHAIIETVNATCGQPNGAAYIVAEFGGTGAFSYYWNPGGYVTDSIYGLNSGIYNVVITDINGCSITYNVSVGVTQPPHIDNVNYANATCYGYNNGWAEIYASGGSAPYSYTWSPNVGSAWSNYSLSAGIYSVTIQDSDGCRLYTNIPISQPDKVEIYTSGDKLICIGDSALISATASGGVGPYYFTWQGLGMGTSFFVAPTITTDYYAFATDANGCISDNGVVRIDVAPPLSIIALTPSTICYGDVVTIVATASGGDGNYIYHWSNGVVSVNNTLQLTAIESTHISVFVTDGCNTKPDTAIVAINIAPEPEINLLKNPFKGCAPLNVVFNNVTNIMTYSYNWDFGDITSGSANWSDLKQPEHYYEKPGIYTVTCEVTTNLGCKKSDVIVIVVHDAPTADFQAHPWSTGLFDARIDFNDNTSSAIAWEWDFGDGYKSGLQNPQHTYINYGKFPVQLVAYNQEGCSDTIVKTVEIIEDMLFYVPTAINVRSPGNDEFYPKGSGINLLTYEMTIYNRWGEPIFHTTDFYAHWQGRYNDNKGDYVPQGVYAWVITVTDKWGKDHTFSGNVTVFK